MEMLFEEERASLVDQHMRDERAVSDMEEKLQCVRQSVRELEKDYSAAINEHKESKFKWEKYRNELLKQIAELKDNLLEENVSSKNQLSAMKKVKDELLLELEGAQKEVEILKKEVARQTARAEHCVTLHTQVEKQAFELQLVTDKVKQLEYERDCHEDWKH